MYSKLIVLLLCFPIYVHACEQSSLIAGGWSHHLSDEDYNEQHNGIGVTCDKWSVMAFENSYYRDAIGVGYETDPFFSYSNFSTSAYIGAWSGYQNKTSLEVGGVTPVGGIRGRLNIGRFGIVVTSVVVVTTIHVEWRFK